MNAYQSLSGSRALHAHIVRDNERCFVLIIAMDRESVLRNMDRLDPIQVDNNQRHHCRFASIFTQ